MNPLKYKKKENKKCYHEEHKLKKQEIRKLK